MPAKSARWGRNPQRCLLSRGGATGAGGGGGGGCKMAEDQYEIAEKKYKLFFKSISYIDIFYPRLSQWLRLSHPNNQSFEITELCYTTPSKFEGLVI